MEGVPSATTYGDLTNESKASWQAIQGLLAAGVNIETALDGVDGSAELLRIVEGVIAATVYAAETHAIDELFAAQATSEMARFIEYIGRVAKPLEIITTNYDRLIEYSARLAGYYVDDLFSGGILGVFGKELSRAEQKIWGVSRGRQTVASRPHIRLYKPHGSLDWYELPDGSVIRTEHRLSMQRRIVAPGRSKLQAGYLPIFDSQRISANEAISSATGFLLVGFGFNDSHLQTYLHGRLTTGTPALILTKALTPAAQSYVLANPGVSAIYEGQPGQSSIFAEGATAISIDEPELWRFGTFLTKILRVPA